MVCSGFLVLAMLPLGIPARKGLALDETYWSTEIGLTAITMVSACTSQKLSPIARANSIGTAFPRAWDRRATTRTEFTGEAPLATVYFFVLTSHQTYWTSCAVTTTGEPS